MSNIELNSVGTAVDENCITHPIFADGTIDMDEGMAVHLLDTDNDWWGHMSVEDSNNLMGFLTPLFFNNSLTDWPLSFVDWGMERLQWVINNNYIIDELENTLLSGSTI